MKVFIMLLSILNISIVHASESVFFSVIPSHVTIDQAIFSVNTAALKRKWTAYGLENNESRIELNHRGYKAVLKFSFSKNEIRYTDFTTYYDEIEDDGYIDDESGTWKSAPVPSNWIRNLKNDVNALFVAIPRGNLSTKESFSHENIVKKLESLKILYDKKMITETEYKLKKKEIMSRY